MILSPRRIAGDDIRTGMIGHFILAQRQFHRDDGGHRLDAINVDGTELFDELEHGVQLFLEVGHLLIAHGNARKMRDAADGGLVNGHENSVEERSGLKQRVYREGSL